MARSIARRTFLSNFLETRTQRGVARVFSLKLRGETCDGHAAVALNWRTLLILTKAISCSRRSVSWYNTLCSLVVVRQFIPFQFLAGKCMEKLRMAIRVICWQTLPSLVNFSIKPGKQKELLRYRIGDYRRNRRKKKIWGNDCRVE